LNTALQLTITFEHLPKPRTEDVFLKCRLVDNKNDIIASDIQVEINGSVISCALPFIKGFIAIITRLFSKMGLTLPCASF
jgi:hypothetical protein